MTRILLRILLKLGFAERPCFDLMETHSPESRGVLCEVPFRLFSCQSVLELSYSFPVQFRVRRCGGAVQYCTERSSSRSSIANYAVERTASRYAGHPRSLSFPCQNPRQGQGISMSFRRHREILSDGHQIEGPEATRKPLPAQRRNESPVEPTSASPTACQCQSEVFGSREILSQRYTVS